MIYDVIYTRTYATMSLSVCLSGLSVTEVH